MARPSLLQDQHLYVASVTSGAGSGVSIPARGNSFRGDKDIRPTSKYALRLGWSIKLDAEHIKKASRSCQSAAGHIEFR